MKSTLIKFQRVRTTSKTTMKKRTIICVEITPRKIQKSNSTLRREYSAQNAQSPQIYGQLDQTSAETVRSTKYSLPRNQANSPLFTHQKESSQPICNANQLTGFHKRRTPFKRYFKTDWVPLCGLWASCRR